MFARLAIGAWTVNLLFSLVLSTPAYGNPKGQVSPELIQVYSRGWSPVFRDYHIDVLKTSLNYSVQSMGPYDLEQYIMPLTVSREFAELGKGQLFQVNFNSENLIDTPEGRAFINFRYPLYKGLLGLRKLIIRNEDKEKFGPQMSADIFKQLAAGQGLKWADIKIYKHAGIDVMESPDSLQLIPLLAAKRFDYFPLSILEIDVAFDEYSKNNTQVGIADNIYIYYPISVNISVSKNREKTMSRIEYGISMAEKEGKLNALFNEYFAHYISNIIAKKSTLFVLVNPHLSQDENRRQTKVFVQHYFANCPNIYFMGGRADNSGDAIYAE